MLELFEMENQGGITISEQRGVSRSHPIEVLPPEDVARAIVEAMENPRAEVYTHPGSRELALQAECDVEAFEREQNPFFIANRLAYERARTKQM